MGGQALQMPDGTVQHFDNEQIPGAVAAGAKAPDTVWIDVQAPDGTVKQSQVPYSAAERLGSALTPEDTLATNTHLADLEDQTSATGAFGRGLVDELSFGALKSDDEQALADSHYHGIAAGTGRLAGAVGPLLVPGLGEAGLARDVAGIGREVEAVGSAVRGSREASALERAAEFLPGRALAQAGAGLTERLGGGLYAHAVAGASEEAGRAALRAMLDRDVPLSGESILDSALFGLAGGAVGYGVSKAIKRAEDGIEELKGRLSRSPRVDDEALVARLNSNREPTAAMRKASETEHAAGIRASLQSDVALAGANQAAVRDVASLERQVKAWRSDPFAPDISRLPALAEQLDKGLESARVLRTFAKQSPEVQARTMAAYGEHLHNIDSMAHSATQAGMAVDGLPNRFMPGNIAARQQALSAIEAGGSEAEQAAQRLAVRLTAGTERAAVARDVADSLLSRVPIVGKLLGKASESPLLSLGILDAVVGGGLGHIAGPALAIKGAAKLVSKAYEVPGRGVALASKAGGELGRLGIHDADRDDPVAAVRAIRALTPERASEDAVRSAHALGDVHVGAVLAAGNAAANRQSALLRRLDAIFPPRQGIVPLGRVQPTSLQVRELNRALSIAADPAAFARLWAAGRLTGADLSFAQQVWPAHVARAKLLALSWLSDRDPSTVSRSVAARLEQLLGADAVGSRRTDSLVAAQASIAAANARTQQAHKTGGPAGVSPRKAPSSALMDPALAASTRPSDG